MKYVLPFALLIAACVAQAAEFGVPRAAAQPDDLLEPLPLKEPHPLDGGLFPNCIGFERETESAQNLFAKYPEGKPSIDASSDYIALEAYGAEPLNVWREAQLTYRAVNATATPVRVLFFGDSIHADLSGSFHREARIGKPINPLSGRFGPPADADSMVIGAHYKRAWLSGNLGKLDYYESDFRLAYRWPVQRPFWVLLHGEGYCRLYQTNLPEWLEWDPMDKERETGFYLGSGTGTFAQQVADLGKMKPNLPLVWLGKPKKAYEATGWSGPTAVKIFAQGPKAPVEKKWQTIKHEDIKEWHRAHLKENVDQIDYDNPSWIKTTKEQVSVDPPPPSVLRIGIDGKLKLSRDGLYIGPPAIPGATGPLQLLIEPQWPIIKGRDVLCTILVGNVSERPLWLWPNELHPSQVVFTLHRQPKPLPNPRMLGAPVQLELGPKLATLDGEALAPLKQLQPLRGPEYVMPGEFRSFRRTLPASFFEKLKLGEPFQIRAEINTPWLVSTVEQATSREVTDEDIKMPEKPGTVFGASMVYKIEREKK